MYNHVEVAIVQFEEIAKEDMLHSKIKQVDDREASRRGGSGFVAWRPGGQWDHSKLLM